MERILVILDKNASAYLKFSIIDFLKNLGREVSLSEKW